MSLTSKINRYLYRSGNTKAKREQIKINRGGVWMQWVINQLNKRKKNIWNQREMEHGYNRRFLNEI